MAWTSGFFNSVNGDRVYTAEQMSSIFDGLITNGVYESVGNKLVVEPHEGMTIQVNTGRGWFGGKWVNNDALELKTLQNADVTLNRYAAITISLYPQSQSVRAAKLEIKYGDLAENPIKPTMWRNETVQEYCLAYIYIKAGAKEITAADIEDTRADTDLCGWVTGLIKQVDSKTMWTQWQALFNNSLVGLETQFETWFKTLQGYLAEDAAAQIGGEIALMKNGMVKRTATLQALEWYETAEAGVYTQTVAVDAVLSDSTIMVHPTPEYKDVYRGMNCEATGQVPGSVIFTCTNPNDSDITVEFLIINI